MHRNTCFVTSIITGYGLESKIHTFPRFAKSYYMHKIRDLFLCISGSSSSLHCMHVSIQNKNSQRIMLLKILERCKENTRTMQGKY